MKQRVKLLSIFSIITTLFFLWYRIYLGKAVENFKFGVMGLLSWILILLFVFGFTWFLYRKEWRNVLGLTTKGITKKIIFKAIGTGLLINIIYTISFLFIYIVIFKEFPAALFGNNVNALQLLSIAIFVAPLVEELLFRGFIQGLWQKLYDHKEKMPIKLIIVTTALLFTISHFGFLFNVSVKQFLFTTVPLFILALYMSGLRYKYQSIVPSIFAHLGFNLNMVFMGVLMIILAFAAPKSFQKVFAEIERAKYEKDTIPYNFDCNDMVEWDRSYHKFCALEKPRSIKSVEHLKGDHIEIGVTFYVDTCGYIYNIQANMREDSAFYSQYGYHFADEAVQFIQSLPQHKPKIVDGKKTEPHFTVGVKFY